MSRELPYSSVGRIRALMAAIHERSQLICAVGATAQEALLRVETSVPTLRVSSTAAGDELAENDV